MAPYQKLARFLLHTNYAQETSKTLCMQQVSFQVYEMTMKSHSSSAAANDKAAK